MIRHDSLQSWAADVRAGRIRLMPGTPLSHAQLAALRGYGNAELHANAATGAPGSRMALDATEAHRRTIAAASALQRQEDIAAAHSVPGGDTVASLARKLTAQHKTAWAAHWQRHDALRLGEAPKDTTQSIRQKLDQAALPQIQGNGQTQTEDRAWREAQERMRQEGGTLVTGQPGASYAERIERQFREAEHGPAQDGTAAALATLQQMLERLIQRLEKYMAESSDPQTRLSLYAHRQRRTAA
ncbi:MAG: hypothetical protein AB7N91_32125 [Candidatus Tectimicrobiota bacterium]